MAQRVKTGINWNGSWRASFCAGRMGGGEVVRETVISMVDSGHLLHAPQRNNFGAHFGLLRASNNPLAHYPVSNCVGLPYSSIRGVLTAFPLYVTRLL